MYKSNRRRRGIRLQHYLVILELGHQHSTAYSEWAIEIILVRAIWARVPV